MPSRCPVPSSEERDKKAITGISSLFKSVSLRALLNLKLVIPLVHVFHSVRTVPVWDVFNEKGMFAGFFIRGWTLRQGANPCYYLR